MRGFKSLVLCTPDLIPTHLNYRMWVIRETNYYVHKLFLNFLLLLLSVANQRTDIWLVQCMFVGYYRVDNDLKHRYRLTQINNIDNDKKV